MTFEYRDDEETEPGWRDASSPLGVHVQLGIHTKRIAQLRVDVAKEWLTDDDYASVLGPFSAFGDLSHRQAQTLEWSRLAIEATLKIMPSELRRQVLDELTASPIE